MFLFSGKPLWHCHIIIRLSKQIVGLDYKFVGDGKVSGTRSLLTYIWCADYSTLQRKVCEAT